MNVQKDAAEVLVVLYKKYLENVYSVTVTDHLAKELGWESDRAIRAVLYLSDSNMIRAESAGQLIMRLYPEGINTIENEGKFKATFGINLGIFNVTFEKK